MNYAIQGTARRLMPGLEEPLKRSGGIAMRPGADRTSTGSRARRHSLPRILAAVLHRRRTRGPTRPGSRDSTSSGVSPIASGASRGFALLSSR
jgi:hypothetical protein